MTHQESRVSVALCTYNGARFLREQLESIVAQTLKPAELVVCDDRSEDETVAIVQSFVAQAAFPVRIQRNAATLGVTANYAQAIEMCAEDYIALADQDDIWLPQKLERLVTVLDVGDAAFAFSDARLVDDAGKDLGGKSLLARRFTLDSIRRGFEQQRELDLILKRDFIYGTTLVFRAEHRDLVLPIPPSWSHDTWIANVLAFHGCRGAAALEPLVFYRQHAVQASGGTSDPKWVDYPARVRAYEDLLNRLGSAESDLRPDALARVRDKLVYLRAMAEMDSASLVKRGRIVTREIASSRWFRYTPRTFLVDKRVDPSSIRARVRK
jgi:glycosyltransferase involved in cell wall biosynthesis